MNMHFDLKMAKVIWKEAVKFKKVKAKKLFDFSKEIDKKTKMSIKLLDELSNSNDFKAKLSPEEAKNLTLILRFQGENLLAMKGITDLVSPLVDVVGDIKE